MGVRVGSWLIVESDLNSEWATFYHRDGMRRHALAREPQVPTP